MVCISQTEMQVPSLRYENDLPEGGRYDLWVSKSRPKRFTNWYLRAWMEKLGVDQAKLIDRTDHNKTTVSLLVNDQQDYSPKYVRDFARALNIAPYELFLHPDDAFGLRKLMSDAERAGELRRRLRVVSDNTEKTGTDD